MKLIDRLNVLYKERYMEIHDIDAWNDAIEKAWPKLLDVIEAAKHLQSHPSEPWQEKHRRDKALCKALDALDEEGEG